MFEISCIFQQSVANKRPRCINDKPYDFNTGDKSIYVEERLSGSTSPLSSSCSASVTLTILLWIVGGLPLLPWVFHGVRPSAEKQQRLESLNLGSTLSFFFHCSRNRGPRESSVWCNLSCPTYSILSEVQCKQNEAYLFLLWFLSLCQPVGFRKHTIEFCVDIFKVIFRNKCQLFQLLLTVTFGGSWYEEKAAVLLQVNVNL